jgi:hypothetical protein
MSITISEKSGTEIRYLLIISIDRDIINSLGCGPISHQQQ